MTDLDIADCGRPASDCPNEYDGKNRRKWSVEKKVGIDALVAFIILLLTMVSYVSIHAKWEGHVDDTLVTLGDNDKRHDKELSNQNDSLNKRLDRIEDKLDAVISNRGHK